MVKQRESSEVVKDRIMDVAAELFGRHGIQGVSIRSIAAGAGINHALVIRYFGSKADLVSAILRREISSLTGAYSLNPGRSAAERLAGLRGILRHALTAENSTMKLIMRTGLDGLSPESYVGEDTGRAANILAKWISSQQAQSDTKLPDARLISVVVMGALFSLVSISPWLMTSVGFAPDDFEKHKEDIIDALIWIIAQAAGLPPAAVDILKSEETK